MTLEEKIDKLNSDFYAKLGSKRAESLSKTLGQLVTPQVEKFTKGFAAELNGDLGVEILAGTLELMAAELRVINAGTVADLAQFQADIEEKEHAAARRN